MSTEEESHDPALEARLAAGRARVQERERARQQEEREFLDAYAGVETWLQDATVGSTKLLVLSDMSALDGINARIHDADQLDPEDLDQNSFTAAFVKKAQIEEGIRAREDTVPGYHASRKELNSILQEKVYPYERESAAKHIAKGVDTTMSHGVSSGLALFRNRVLSTNAPTTQSPSA